MLDSNFLLPRYGRLLLYAVPICVMLFSATWFFGAMRNEVTGVAKGRKNLNQTIAYKEKEPEKFRERTNQLWAAGGWMLTIGIVGFLFARKIDRYISNED